MATLLGTEIERYPLITARLGAATSPTFYVTTESGYTSVSITANNLSVGESIPVQILAGDGVTWGDATTTHPTSGLEVAVELTYGANTITLIGLGAYRINKGVTALPTSVTLFR